VVDLNELEIPVVQEALAVALREAVETGQAKRLRFDWEVGPAGMVSFCLSLEEEEGVRP
jgi:hypothetical protein